MEKKNIGQEEVMIIIKDNFSPGQPFSNNNLKKVSFIADLNANYFLNLFAKKGLIEKLSRSSWMLPIDESIPSDKIKPLYVSAEEKNILQKVFDMELKAVNGKLRFNLKKLKEIISEEQVDLINDLLPKLKNLGIMACVGNGVGDEKIMEINENLFLKYMIDDHIKIISLSDAEIDRRINHLISEAMRKNQLKEEVAEELEEKTSKLQICLEEIKNLEKQRESLEKDIKNLQSEHDKLNQIDEESITEQQFIVSLSEMSPERRRNIFKKVLGK